MSYGFFNLLVRIVCFLIFEISNCSSKIFDNSYALRLVSSSICIHGIVLQLLTIVPCLLTAVVSKSAFGVSTDDSLVKFTQKKHLFRDFSTLCGASQSDIKTELKKTFSGNRKNFRAEVPLDNHKQESSTACKLSASTIFRSKMPKTYKRFAVGEFMKAKRDIAVQVAEEKARALSEIKLQQQKVCRLNEKVFFSILCDCI